MENYRTGIIDLGIKQSERMFPLGNLSERADETACPT
jgi:hypothetical protein